MEKYIILNPWPAGFTNVLMSYEIVFALAYITNRSIILPPTSWCVLIDDRKSSKETWQDIWQICDRNAANEEFKTYDLLEFEEFKPVINELTNTDNYSWVQHGVGNIGIRDIPHLNDSQLCLYDSTHQYNESDFQNFTKNRTVVDVNESGKFFKSSAFGHYWYNIYANGPEARNEMKRKVNKSFKYKLKYYSLAETAIKAKCDSYNAIHVRSPWQLNYDEHSDVVHIKDKPHLLLQQVKLLYSADKPLYIATDIEHKSFFDQLATEYKIIFYEDLALPVMQPLEKIAIDQIICSKADIFYGSYYSTFSKRINVMRGLEGRQSSDYMGFNKIVDNSIESKTPWPWQDTTSKHWFRHDSSYLQWTKE